MIVQLFYGTRSPTRVGTLTIDVVMEESHTWQNDVTTNPVEDGLPTSDYVKPVPDKISMRGLASTASIDDRYVDPQVAFNLLDRLREAKEPVTVRLPLRSYRDMIVTSVTIPRRPTLGDAIEYVIECQQIRRVSSRSVELPAGIGKKKAKSVGKRAQPEAKKGLQPTQRADSERTSVLGGIFR